MRRKEKQKAKEEKELEKRRIKEEKLKKLAEERETKKKQKTKLKSGSGSLTMQPSLEHFVQSENNAVPVILEKCVRFIEEEGLDSEGIYRVPGNRAHVELLFHKFEEGKISCKTLSPTLTLSPSQIALYQDHSLILK